MSQKMAYDSICITLQDVVTITTSLQVDLMAMPSGTLAITLPDGQMGLVCESLVDQILGPPSIIAPPSCFRVQKIIRNGNSVHRGAQSSEQQCFGRLDKQQYQILGRVHTMVIFTRVPDRTRIDPGWKSSVNRKKARKIVQSCVFFNLWKSRLIPGYCRLRHLFKIAAIFFKNIKVNVGALPQIKSRQAVPCLFVLPRSGQGS